MAPVTRYARSGEASIAYQSSARAAGRAVRDGLDHPDRGTCGRRRPIAASSSAWRPFGRLILFDSRGTGMSERVLDTYTVEQEAQDALAVLDAAGSERAAVLTYAQGGLVGAVLAADHPERIGALVMYASVARTSWAPDYDWAMTREQREELKPSETSRHGERRTARRCLRGRRRWPMTRPWSHGLPACSAWPPARARRGSSRGPWSTWTCARRCRASACPRWSCTAPRRWCGTCATRCIWPSTSRAPATSSSRGSIPFPFVGDGDAILEEIEEFLTGGRGSGELARALLTVMFTDIVDATARAAEIGDGRWRDLLARHRRGGAQGSRPLRRPRGQDVR